ncbi:MAG TPA: right-handed parallel beta-helix repeat-containing protein [Gammaproteobacteria bacterium]|nr:right-handed parallel beta-helix repeat-containing protein [Gammaproteobacteria bacterium]
MKLKNRLLVVIGSLLFSTAVYADEGRIYITAPTAITAPGSYLLINDVVGTFDGISIQSSNVKLDLNGFTISHTGASLGDGVAIYPEYKNIEITNGAITGFTRHGIFVPGKSAAPRNIKISGLRISDNSIDGISMEGNPGFIIEDCVLSGGAIGIYTFAAGLVLNNVIGNNSSGGLVAYTNRLGYRSNVFYGNTPDVSGSGTNLGDNLCSGALCP